MRIILILCLACTSLSSQIITGTYDFQTDPEKKYALYIPFEYDAEIPSKVIVGLHPWNTTNWDAESWAEELSELAELNNTIVICPDGGADGQIDDDIDTSFTTFLIEQVALDYNINRDSMYLVGFSWGARTVYSYGLSNKSKFAGFMPIGAAVELSVVSDLIVEVENLPFYIIHGNLDNPGVRFYPLRDALQEAGACVETNLLSLVGHTIFFPDQLNVLNNGFQWLLNNSCLETSNVMEEDIPQLISQTLYYSGDYIQFEKKERFHIYSIDGSQVLSASAQEINLNLNAGNYILTIENNRSYRIVIL